LTNGKLGNAADIAPPMTPVPTITGEIISVLKIRITSNNHF
jgi:hypothetical protein